MSAQEQMRRMLDELMGTRRNGDQDCNKKLSYKSSRVCKSFLLKCCPHEILVDTRCDMGQCTRIHDVALRADYENSSRSDEYAYQKEALQQLKSFISQREKRTQMAKIRLAEAQEHFVAEEALRAQRIQLLENRITGLLSTAEQLGVQGDVDGSLKIMDDIETLKQEKKDIQEEYKNSTPSSLHQQQKLRVCEVCASYLGIHDNDKRLADHFNGRLHLGFITIREKLKELEDLVENHHIRQFVASIFEGKGQAAKRSPSPPLSPSPEPPKRRRHERSRSRDRKPSHKSSHKSRHRKHHHKSRTSSASSQKPDNASECQSEL